LSELGAQAVRQLHRILALKENEIYKPEQIWLQPELVVRDSSLK
jgi:DNA-binding LacI/PurR family transcriptional regulator